MTYRDLLEELKRLTPQELDLDATVLLDDINAEFFPVTCINFAEETDVLDKGHPVIVVGGVE